MSKDQPEPSVRMRVFGAMWSDRLAGVGRHFRGTIA